jgi:transposase-like protein
LCADRFRINRHACSQGDIFVDETLLQIIDGKDYWLWVAYEPNVKKCLMIYLCQEKEQFSFVISSSNTAAK